MVQGAPQRGPNEEQGGEHARAEIMPRVASPNDLEISEVGECWGISLAGTTPTLDGCIR